MLKVNGSVNTIAIVTVKPGIAAAIIPATVPTNMKISVLSANICSSAVRISSMEEFTAWQEDVEDVCKKQVQSK